MQGELEASEQRVSVLTDQLGATTELRVELETAHEELQNTKDRLKTVEEDLWESKLATSERDALLAEREVEMNAVKEMNANVVAEIRERHDFAEKIRDNWRVIKATVETFQCGEVAPCEPPDKLPTE